jgi:protein-disulfide isomerase
MDKRFLTIIAIILVGFLGFVMVNNNKKAADTKSTVAATNHVRGNTSSNVTFLEYADFQCPACASFNPTIEEVYEKYKDTVKFQFRNLPLTQLHKNAVAAARAAEAADMQGKYWEMNQLLYERSNWSTWTTSDKATTYFEQYARQLNLDVAKFTADSKSQATNDRVNADKAAFAKTGSEQSTPTFFLNGEKVENSALLDSQSQPSVEAFSKLLDEALAASKKS